MTVRAPAWAGQFYPDDPKELARRVDGLLDAAPPAKLEGPVVAALCPHAGYEYSGACAAKAYKALRGQGFDLAVVVGTHYPYEQGLFLSPYDVYRTPLGEVPVAAEAARKLKAAAQVALSSQAHADHSVEVQIPFLQRLLGKFELLPLVANLPDPEEAERLGEALAAATAGRRAVFIASSDLSHFPSADSARKVDPASLAAFLTMDARYLYLADRLIMERGAPGLRCAWCGLGAAAVVLCAARRLGADCARLLGGANSSQAGGDTDRTVGYGAAVLLRSNGSGRSRGIWPTLDLSEEEGRELVALARTSLEERLRRRRPAGPRLFDRSKFNLPAAVFVTWERGDWKEGGLRGCIGTMEARETLGNAVMRYAVASAEGDPRFEPVTLAELPGLKAEVTVLSPLRDIRPDEVAPGLGIHVARGGREGIFLPQVWEKFSGVEEFMSVLCRQKAGLPAEAWREPGTKLRAFRARCFQ